MFGIKNDISKVWKSITFVVIPTLNKLTEGKLIILHSEDYMGKIKKGRKIAKAEKYNLYFFYIVNFFFLFCKPKLVYKYIF